MMYALVFTLGALTGALSTMILWVKGFFKQDRQVF